MVRKYIIVVVSIVAIIICIDLFVGAFSKKMILGTHDVGVNQTNAVQAMFKRDMDVLILGPSSANHHYNCRIIKDSLNLKAYNAGRDGQNIVYSYMVLAATLEHHVPRIVILDITRVMLDGSWNNHLSEMNCFYGLNNQVDAVINDVSDWKTQLMLNLNLYRYNNTLPWLINSYFAHSQADLDGYRPLPEHKVNMTKKQEDNVGFNAEEIDYEYFKKLVSTCKESQIKLIVCISPCLNVDGGGFVSYIDEFCKKNDIIFYSWNGDEKYINRPDLFYDMNHLNSVGADLFTEELISVLKHE